METALKIALISAGTSIATVLLLKPFVDSQLLRFQIKLNHKAEQSKKIKDVISKYKNGLLKSGEKLNNRFKNFAKNHGKDWHKVNGAYQNESHYIDTTVYWFLAFSAHIQLIEKKLIHIDTTISRKSDLRLVKYFRMFHDVMCDVDLFEGVPYDSDFAIDHFFSTPFANMSNVMIDDDDVINLDDFISRKNQIQTNIEPLYRFIDGVNTTEARYRFDRLKIFHLCLVSFMNEFGYDYQKTKKEKFDELKQLWGQYRFIDNLEKHFIRRYKLNKCFGTLERNINRIRRN